MVFHVTGFTVNGPMELTDWSIHCKGNTSHWVPTGLSVKKNYEFKQVLSFKRCEGCFTNIFFDPGVGMGAAVHQAVPQRNTNWVLMRSTASVSEEPI